MIWGWGANNQGQLALGHLSHITTMSVDNAARLASTVNVYNSTNGEKRTTLGQEVRVDESYDTYTSYQGGYGLNKDSQLFGTYDNSQNVPAKDCV